MNSSDNYQAVMAGEVTDQQHDFISLSIVSFIDGTLLLGAIYFHSWCHS